MLLLTNLNDIAVRLYDFAFIREDGYVHVTGKSPMLTGDNGRWEPYTCILPHIHPDIEIITVVDGELDVTVGAAQRRITAGCTMIVNRFDDHCGYMPKDSQHLHYYCLLFNPEHFISAMPQSAAALTHEICRGDKQFVSILDADDSRSRNIHALLPGLFEKCYAFSDRDRLRMLPGMYTLLDILLHECVTDGASHSQSFDFVLRVNEYIDQNFADELSTEQIARDFSYSKSYFCRRFRECFGMTFTDYLCRYRVTYAATNLRGRELPLTAIAEAAGFGDYTHFARQFKKFMGTSPSGYFKRPGEK
ncbi:MAG: helix-turn-helix domain-containing protein [Clostridia bacterium]|nr:helix-turn-helix domain-containing protein [Clostridia bacterium]